MEPENLKNKKNILKQELIIDVQSTINKLLNELIESSDKHNESLIIQSRLKRINDADRNGTLSFNKKNRQINKLQADLLNLIDLIEISDVKNGVLSQVTIPVTIYKPSKSYNYSAYGLKFSSNGNFLVFYKNTSFLALTRRRGNGKILNINTGEIVKRFKGQKNEKFLGIDLSPDSTKIVVLSKIELENKGSYFVKILDFTTASVMKTYKKKHNWYSVKNNNFFLFDGRSIFLPGYKNLSFNTLDIISGNKKKVPLITTRFQTHNVSKSGNYIAMSMSDFDKNKNTIHVWDLKNEKKLANLEGHSGYIRTLRISNNEKYLISGSNDCTAKIWKLVDGKEIFSINSFLPADSMSSWVYHVGFSYDDKHVYATSWRKTTIWDIEKIQEVVTIPRGATDHKSVCPHPNENAIAICTDNQIEIWEY